MSVNKFDKGGYATMELMDIYPFRKIDESQNMGAFVIDSVLPISIKEVQIL